MYRIGDVTQSVLTVPTAFCADCAHCCADCADCVNLMCSIVSIHYQSLQLNLVLARYQIRLSCLFSSTLSVSFLNLLWWVVVVLLVEMAL